MKSTVNYLSKILLSILIIGASSLIAIVLHAALPAKVDETLLDGLLVKNYGFPVVAAAYFSVLFTHCTAVLILNRNKLISSNVKPEFSFALSFSLIYMTGMQEIVLDTGSFSQWGISFINYQVLLGIGDAIPAIILCLLIGNIFFKGQKNERETERVKKVFTILSFMILVGTVRLIASKVGAIKTDILEYPTPVVIWGYILGFVFGLVYLLVEDATISKTKTMVLGIGINWMIFNSFIGLIKKDAMPDALLRSAIDLVSILIAMKLSTIMRKSMS